MDSFTLIAVSPLEFWFTVSSNSDLNMEDANLQYFCSDDKIQMCFVFDLSGSDKFFSDARLSLKNNLGIS